MVFHENLSYKAGQEIRGRNAGWIMYSLKYNFQASEASPTSFYVRWNWTQPPKESSRITDIMLKEYFQVWEKGDRKDRHFRVLLRPKPLKLQYGARMSTIWHRSSVVKD